MAEADDIFGDVRARLDSHAPRAAVWSIAAFPGVRFNGHGIDLGSSLFSDHAPCIIEAITLAQALASSIAVTILAATRLARVELPVVGAE